VPAKLNVNRAVDRRGGLALLRIKRILIHHRAYSLVCPQRTQERRESCFTAVRILEVFDKLLLEKTQRGWNCFSEFALAAENRFS